MPEDLSFNDQESIIELVVEKILGYEDAIEEYDDHEPVDHKVKSAVKLTLINNLLAEVEIKPFILEIDRQEFPAYESPITSGFKKQYSPPPEI